MSIYRELSEVERAFAKLKDVIEMRPFFHQTAQTECRRISSQLWLSLLHPAVEKKLKAKGADLSATQALQALRLVRVVDIELGGGAVKRPNIRGT